MLKPRTTDSIIVGIGYKAVISIVRKIIIELDYNSWVREYIRYISCITLNNCITLVISNKQRLYRYTYGRKKVSVVLKMSNKWCKSWETE